MNMDGDEQVTPPCRGLWWLFDSTDVGDHIIARDYCEHCPIRDACHDGFEAARATAKDVRAGGPQGTWAGVLYGATSQPLRVKLGTCRGCKNQMVTATANRVFGYVRHEARGYCTNCYSPRRREAS